MNLGLSMLAVGAILAASVGVAFGAAKTGLPVLVAFLGLGMVLGSDGPGGIEFSDAKLAREVGVVSLVAILYEGGLSTSWRRLRAVAAPAVVLSTLGVVVTAGVTGLAARAFFDLTWSQALLLGAVVASTDAAAVFATLRTTRLRRSLARTLEAESGANDPVAIALTLGLISVIEKPDYRIGDLTVLLIRQLGLGLARRRRAGRRGDLALRADSGVDRALRPGSVGRNRRARLRCGRRDPRQRVPRRLPRGARGRLDAVALPGPARDVPHRVRLRGAGRAVHRPRPARLPFAAARRRARVARRDGRARAARAPARRLGLGRAAAPLHDPRARAARVGGAPRSGADRARHLRPLLARLGRGHDLQCSVLRRAGVDRAAGDDPRVARAPARPARRPCRPRSRPSRSRGRGAR